MVTSLLIMRNKGGRGKTNPYKTTLVRVPEPIKNLILEISDKYREYVLENDTLEFDSRWLKIVFKPIVKYYKHGGSRINSGRPIKESCIKDKVIRVDEETYQFIVSNKKDELISIITDWLDTEKYASPTSPRWEQARILLHDLEKVIS